MVSSAVEHRLHTAGATGSIPVPSTRQTSRNTSLICITPCKNGVFVGLRMYVANRLRERAIGANTRVSPRLLQASVRSRPKPNAYATGVAQPAWRVVFVRRREVAAMRRGTSPSVASLLRSLTGSRLIADQTTRHPARAAVDSRTSLHLTGLYCLPHARHAMRLPHFSLWLKVGCDCRHSCLRLPPGASIVCHNRNRLS